MAAFIDVLSEEFESLYVEARERDKYGEPFCAHDYQERFTRICTRIKDDVGIDGTQPQQLMLLYKSYESERMKGTA